MHIHHAVQTQGENNWEDVFREATHLQQMRGGEWVSEQLSMCKRPFTNQVIQLLIISQLANEMNTTGTVYTIQFSGKNWKLFMQLVVHLHNYSLLGAWKHTLLKVGFKAHIFENDNAIVSVYADL